MTAAAPGGRHAAAPGSLRRAVAVAAELVEHTNSLHFTVYVPTSVERFDGWASEQGFTRTEGRAPQPVPGWHAECGGGEAVVRGPGGVVLAFECEQPPGTARTAVLALCADDVFAINENAVYVGTTGLSHAGESPTAATCAALGVPVPESSEDAGALAAFGRAGELTHRAAGFTDEEATRSAYVERVRVESEIAESVGRWAWGCRTPPTSLFAGDAAAFRARANDLVLRWNGKPDVPAGPTSRVGGSDVHEPYGRPEGASVASMSSFAAVFAVPFWLDERTCGGLLGSDPPGADLTEQMRLPFPAVLVVPATAVPVPGGYPVVGFVLFDGGDGTPDDVFVAYTLRNGLFPLLGRLSRLSEDLDGPVRNLVAAVCFGPFDQPDDPPPQWDPLRTAKSMKKGAVRHRAEPKGTLSGVWVIDTRRMHAHASAPTGDGRSPAPHMRRGHWRRVRCGPRDGWWYETRWIPPALVLGGAPPDSRKVTVYRSGNRTATTTASAQGTTAQR